MERVEGSNASDLQQGVVLTLRSVQIPQNLFFNRERKKAFGGIGAFGFVALVHQL